LTQQTPIKAAFDVDAIRRDFPILSTTMHDKPLVFLDSGASAQKPQVVIDAVKDLYETGYANIHRGIYQLSAEATEKYENTRETVRAFINAKSTRECLFVRGATEGINLVAQTWGRANLKAGDEIILTHLEHHSNIVPWQMLRDELGLVMKIAPINDLGEVDLEAYEALLTDKVKFVAMVHISNAIGTINPAKKMIEMAHNMGAKVLVDGCQAIPHMPVDVQNLNADFYAFSGHKVYGPTGIGVLYGKETLLDAMPPWQGGGDMIATVTFEKTTFNELPQKFEAGTPNIAGGVGFGVALDYVSNIGFDAIMAHEADLLAYTNEVLRGINSLKIIGEAKEKATIFSFTLDGIHPHDMGTILDREGIAIRTGHHCAQPLMERFGVTATARASMGLYNTREDIDKLAEGIQKVLRIFG
jgi:cysteine desulfurase/selenocysteine lyase